MTDSDLRSLAAGDLHNSTIDGDALQRIAAAYSDSWPAVRQHPSCYPELAAWLDERLATTTARRESVSRVLWLLGPLSLLGILAVTFPLTSLMGVSLGFFDSAARGVGGLLLCMLLPVLALGIVGTFHRSRPIQITIGAVGFLVGTIILTFSGAVLVSIARANTQLSGLTSMTPGTGLVLLAAGSVAILGVSVVALIPTRTPARS